MLENSNSISLDHIAPILFDELRYADPLTAKEFHKLVHLVHSNLEETEIESELEYFWYKFGSCARTPASSGVSITSTGGGYEARCEKTPEETDLTPEAEDILRKQTRNALDTYYSNDLVHLTDINYRKAPYSVQRAYRGLDQELQSIKLNQGPAATNFDNQSIREKLERVVDSFPIEEFPQHQNELFQMHSIVDRALSEGVSVEKIIGVTDTFWSLFCLDLCQDTATNTSAEDVLEELGFFNVREQKRKYRAKLDDYESEHIEVVESSDNLNEAAEALMSSRLSFAGVSE